MMTYPLSLAWAYSSYSKEDLFNHKEDAAQVSIVGAAFLLDAIAVVVMTIIGILGAALVMKHMSPSVSYSLIGAGVLLATINLSVTSCLTRNCATRSLADADRSRTYRKDTRYFLFFTLPLCS